ncbi:MAG: retroviral-like aspartic protease family protein [Verrucomicrobiales bacterium]|nr:retroviral-like aspartic protease family protein [Verrucomicrobiales bacterium]
MLALVNGAIAAERPPARAPGPQTLATLGYVCVPLQRTAEGHLYARARINGRRCVALVDTGWSFTTLAAQKANRVFKIAARGAQADALIERLDLAKHSFPNQPARVEPLLFDGQPASFDCVLGLDFLRRHYALLDCARGRLYLRFGAPTAPEARRLETLLHECGFDAVPLSFDTPPALTVRAHINARPVDMLVDSAAVWSVLDPRELERLGLRAEPTLARLTGAGSTGTRPVLVAEAPSLTLESARLRSPRFAVMALADWGMASPHAPLPHVGGILGSPELRALEALVDCHGLKLHLRPRQSNR